MNAVPTAEEAAAVIAAMRAISDEPETQARRTPWQQTARLEAVTPLDA